MFGPGNTGERSSNYRPLSNRHVGILPSNRAALTVAWETLPGPAAICLWLVIVALGSFRASLSRRLS
jgi:hypothetical protein